MAKGQATKALMFPILIVIFIALVFLASSLNIQQTEKFVIILLGFVFLVFFVLYSIFS